MSTTTLSERLHAAVQATTEEAGRFKKLSQESGVAEASWKSWWYGRQRPTAEMIEAVCQQAPHFALWITTGVDAPEFGQKSALSPCQDTVIGNEFDALVSTEHYLKLRVQASRSRTKQAKGMAAAYKQLAIDELQYFFNGGPA